MSEEKLANLERRWGDKSDDIIWLVQTLRKCEDDLLTIKSMLLEDACDANKCDGCKFEMSESAFLVSGLLNLIREKK